MRRTPRAIPTPIAVRRTVASFMLNVYAASVVDVEAGDVAVDVLKSVVDDMSSGIICLNVGQLL